MDGNALKSASPTRLSSGVVDGWCLCAAARTVLRSLLLRGGAACRAENGGARPVSPRGNGTDSATLWSAATAQHSLSKRAVISGRRLFFFVKIFIFEALAARAGSCSK
jgi:hypothetical protein